MRAIYCALGQDNRDLKPYFTMNPCLLKIPIQTWEASLSKKPAGSGLLSLVAEIQETAGLNFVFDMLNARVPSLKQIL